MYDFCALDVGGIVGEGTPLEARPADHDNAPQTSSCRAARRAFAADGGESPSCVRCRSTAPATSGTPVPQSCCPATSTSPTRRAVAKEADLRRELRQREVVLAAERREAIGETLNIVDDDLPAARLPASDEACRSARAREVPVPYRVRVPAPTCSRS